MAGGDLLRVSDLKVTFDLESGPLQAVRGVSMRVPTTRETGLPPSSSTRFVMILPRGRVVP